MKFLFPISPAYALIKGQEAPDFFAEDLSGHPVRLGYVAEEKIVILYFWDVRFQICHQGLAELRYLHSQYRDKLTIFAVNIDSEARSDLKNFSREHPWAEDIGKLLLARGGTAQRYDAELSIPVLCIINRSGHVAFYEQSFDKKKVKQAIEELLRVAPWKGLWGQYLWAVRALDLEPFYWGRGDVLSLAFLREGREHWTFEVQASSSYQNPTKYKSEYSHLMSEVASGSATLSLGPPPLRRYLGISLSAGVAVCKLLDEKSESKTVSRSRVRSRTSRNLISLEEDSVYITPVVDLNVRIYIIDQISIYASGGVDLRLIYDALDFERSFSRNLKNLTKAEHVYRYEAGIRVYIKHNFNLNIGYGEWRFGDRNVKGLQIAYGYTF